MLQEKRYSEACAHFNTVLQVQGYRADTCYCVALCHYNLRQYASALKYITEIIERGIKDHPGSLMSPLSLSLSLSLSLAEVYQHTYIINICLLSQI